MRRRSRRSTSRQLERALEAGRVDIEAGLVAAEKELSELREREGQLEALIARAKAALGAEPEPGLTESKRLTLHEAIELVLQGNGNRWTTVRELASEVNRRGLYRKRDGSRVEANQIHARTKNYEALFEKDGPRVRMRPSASSNRNEARPESNRLDARKHLQTLVGKTIRTLTGRPNVVLRLEGDSVIVGTSRSPSGQPVPIKEVQNAMDGLAEKKELAIEVSTVGYRSAFIGAVLSTLPGVRVVPGTRRVRLSCESANVSGS
jgi:hypothetical protein